MGWKSVTGLARRDRRTRSRLGARQGLDRSCVIGNAGRAARGCNRARAGAATSLPSCTGASQLPTRRRSPRAVRSKPAGDRLARSEGCAAAIPVRGAERPSVFGLGLRDDSMLLRKLEGLYFPDPDSTFGILLLPGSESPSGGRASGCIAEQDASGSPARSQPGRLGRYPSKPFRSDRRPSLSGRIQPSNREGRP